MATPDITENIPLNIGNPGVSGFWTNSAEDYDVAIGGEPFFLAPTDQNPYQRETAPYRKDQFDNGKEPGEQSLTGWWIRSQSSFHVGDGIKFYDPSTGESSPYRFADSQGVDVWTKGQITLLNDVIENHVTTGALLSNNDSQQHLRSIRYGTSDGVLLHDEFDVDKIDTAGNLVHFIDYNAGTNDKVYAICDDGHYAYWVTNDTAGSGKLQMWKKLLTGVSGTGDVLMFDKPALTLTNACMEFVKDRIVLVANNATYEISPNATALPTAIYTNPNTNWIATSITASGPAIYISGNSGIYSTIHKYTLSTSGVMPTLSQASVAAELPSGETVLRIYYYLGYMLIGTSRGVRVATINDQDGSLAYGPLVVETTQPVYDFAARDRFVWCASAIDSLNSGLIRIDLGQNILDEPLRFAYANDLQYSQTRTHTTTAVAFFGATKQLAYATAAITSSAVSNKALTSNVATLTTSAAHELSVGEIVVVEAVDATFNGTYTITGVPTTTTFTYAKTASNVVSTAVSPAGRVIPAGHVYRENMSVLRSSGYVTTGAIRYGTLEPKNFKFIRARGDFANGSMDIQTVGSDGTLYTAITYSASAGTPEAATTYPEGSQEYISYKFTLSRSASNTSLGPIFKGYQAKALPATKRQRLIQFPVWCFDVETDRYGVQTGYENRAWERIQTLEAIESAGDIVNVQDFTTGERVQAIIERVNFSRRTPPSGKFDGFGGLLSITVRTVL